MGIELAHDTPAMPTEQVTSSVLTKTAVSKYYVLRSGAQTPEPLRANDDEEIMELIRRQIRKDQTPIVYVYKLLCAEAYTPSSVTLTVEEIEARTAKAVAPAPTVEVATK